MLADGADGKALAPHLLQLQLLLGVGQPLRVVDQSAVGALVEGENAKLGHLLPDKSLEGFLRTAAVEPGADSDKVECVPSIDGNKLLIYTRAAAKYESVGVVDFLRKSYTAFSCADMNDVDERTAYWFDNESVIIEARSDDNSGKDYYIYRISSE